MSSGDRDTGRSLVGFWVELGVGGWSGDRVKVNQENWDSFEPAVTFVVTN